MNHALLEARKYEEITEKKISSEERPDFHLSARVGWMNDPNGFSFYNGKYHMFYQYHPYDLNWGPMHWGHAVSDDLLHWTYLPAALAPDEDYDKNGCFSGSAVSLDDGRHLLMYTGVRLEPQPDGSVRESQCQCIAVGDGVEYEKYPENPVLGENDIPTGDSRIDFRDPKMWREADGSYRCVVGNRRADSHGQILLYSSQDGFHWNFEKILAGDEKHQFGRMWECPDFFELDGNYVLMTSPQDMLPKGLEYHNGNGTLCLIGEYNADGDFCPQYDQAIDYGIDFYAPQTVLTPDGRRVMIGWMQNWDTCKFCSPDLKWFGQMSLPRELSIKNGRLIQKPLRELDEMHKNEVKYENITFSDEICLDGIEGRKIDMELEIRPADSENDPEKLYHKFAVRFAQNEEFHTEVSYRPHESVLKIDRKFSGSRRAVIHQRRSQIPFDNGCLKLRLILDRFSAEIFVNDGEQVLSMTFYTDQSAQGISFLADGSVSMDIVKYDLIG